MRKTLKNTCRYVMVEELEVKQGGSIKILDGDVFLGTQKYPQKHKSGATKINLRKVWKDFSLALWYNLLAVYLHPEDERCKGVVVFDGALISSRVRFALNVFDKSGRSWRSVWFFVIVPLYLGCEGTGLPLNARNIHRKCSKMQLVSN